MLYLADCLPVKHPQFYSTLQRLLIELSVDFRLLPNTKDIWAVDYMPLQIDRNKFVQFIYNPDYLQSARWQKTISNGLEISESIGIKALRSEIVLDGGNTVNAGNKVMVCDKIFNENPAYTRRALLSKLRKVLEVDEICTVPQQKGDIIGHADGMVRFIDEETVLVNDLSKEQPAYQEAFKKSLRCKGLRWVTMPYNPYLNRSNLQANGIYINYLQMRNLIVLPVFGLHEDDLAFRLMEQIFSGYHIEALDCNAIADHGGVLNCISWNVLESR